MRPTCLALMALGLAALGTAGVCAAEPAETAEDEHVLQQAKLGTDGPALLNFFRQRTLNDNDEKRIPELIGQLGDERFDVRKQASDRLVALGVPALPHLRRALNNPDAEVCYRLTTCIETIESVPHAERAAAAARLLMVRKPAGGPAILLAYLPYAGDLVVENEVLLALAVLGVQEGRIDAAITAALEDKVALRRSAAALVLGRYGSDAQKAVVRRLLTDADANIRFRAAQGLIAARDKSATPTLVALLTEAPLDLARQAEDLLGRMAGDKGPGVLLEEDDAGRRKCREAWAAWWKASEGALDLARADVDLTTINRDAQAKEVCRKWVGAIVQRDRDLMGRTMDSPFNMMGIQQFSKEDFIKMVVDNGGPQTKINITEIKMTTVEEYASKAPQEAKQYVDALRKSGNRLVYMRADIDGRKESLLLEVRFRGGKPLVAGFGPGEHQ